MPSIRNLSLRKKLYGSFGLVLALVALLGAVTLVQMSSMNQESSTVSSSVVPAISAADDMRGSANTLDHAISPPASWSPSRLACRCSAAEPAEVAAAAAHDATSSIFSSHPIRFPKQ